MARREKGLLVIEDYENPLLQVGDGRIIGASENVAEWHGFEFPSQLIGKFVSQFADENDRHYYRTRWYQRTIQSQLLQAYPSPIVVGGLTSCYVLRELARPRVWGVHITELTRVKEIDNLAPVADLEALGIDQGAFERYVGRYTAQQLSDLINTPTDQENQCEYDAVRIELLETVKSLGGIEHVLHPDVSLSYANHKLSVRHRNECGACGYVWYSAVQNSMQCANEGCRKQAQTMKRRESALAGLLESLGCATT